MHYIFSHESKKIKKIAELGTFLGQTANLMAELSRDDAKIEIYDFFEHNDQSRISLKNNPKYNERDFFDIWKFNTQYNIDKLQLFKGDIRKTSQECKDSLDILFVDIIKSDSILYILNEIFYNRLRIGGYILHQDYYHWQSPWIVYQMEYLKDALPLVGDFGNNMSIFYKTRDLTNDEKKIDFINDFNFEEKYSLMDQAIFRYPGLRAGNLLTSKLRLSLDDNNFDSKGLGRYILDTYKDNARITGYVKRILSFDTNKMW